jgi:outer membrane protein TolC
VDEAADAGQVEGTRDFIVARAGSDTVLSLRDCVEIAWENNDRLQAERSRRLELAGLRNQALSTGLPSLDLIGEWARGRDPSFALDESFGGGDLPEDFPFEGLLPSPSAIPAQTFWRASADLIWTLNPLQVIGAVGAANLGIDRQELIIEGTRYEVAESTINAYYSLILTNEVVLAREAEVTNQQEFLEITKLRYELGMATIQDTLQAAVSVANLLPLLRRARQEVANAGSRLNAVMGQDPKAALTITREIPIETDPIDRDRALAMALRRPDVEQLELFANILGRNRQAQKAEMRPYLSMFGSFGYVGRTTDTLFDDGHDTWRASVALNIPLFDGMLTRGLVQQTEANILVTENELSGLKRQVEVEVLDLLNSLNTARENYEAARLNLVRSEDLVEQMTMMYRVGKADYLSTLVAESNRSNARENLLQAAYEVLTLTASLKRAIGQSPLQPLTAIEGLVQGVN